MVNAKFGLTWTNFTAPKNNFLKVETIWKKRNTFSFDTVKKDNKKIVWRNY